MSEICVLAPDDFAPFVGIIADAYPGWKIITPEEKKKVAENLSKSQQEDPTIDYHGLFREGRLLGGMRLHDFRMNFCRTEIPTSGVGLVAVHLAHKKEQVAKELMRYFLEHSRAAGAPIAMLYSFRPDFYKNMGFGYGAKIHQYCFAPSALPKGPSKAHVRYLGADDALAMHACYQRLMRRTHGMLVKREAGFERLMKDPKARVVGCVYDGQVQGYLIFGFEHEDAFIFNDLRVREFVYENREALAELLTFLHSQADQIRHVILETQDEAFHYLLTDVRTSPPVFFQPLYHKSNTQGIGIMYRVVDVPKLFELLGEHNFSGQSCRLKLTLADSFMPENAGSTLLAFDQGRPSLSDNGEFDVEIRLDVADFSSLVVGAVDFRSLYNYGLADVSNPDWIDTVNNLFKVETKPICMTMF